MSSKKHYVKNADLYAAMVEYRKTVVEAKTLQKEKPRVPIYIGECIMKIATHLAYKPNFSNYTFRDEMISDGIENCLQYIDNFDPEKCHTTLSSSGFNRSAFRRVGWNPTN